MLKNSIAISSAVYNQPFLRSQMKWSYVSQDREEWPELDHAFPILDLWLVHLFLFIVFLLVFRHIWGYSMGLARQNLVEGRKAHQEQVPMPGEVIHWPVFRKRSHLNHSEWAHNTTISKPDWVAQKSPRVFRGPQSPEGGCETWSCCPHSDST